MGANSRSLMRAGARTTSSPFFNSALTVFLRLALRIILTGHGFCSVITLQTGQVSL